MYDCSAKLQPIISVMHSDLYITHAVLSAGAESLVHKEHRRTFAFKSSEVKAAGGDAVSHLQLTFQQLHKWLGELASMLCTKVAWSPCLGYPFC